MPRTKSAAEKHRPTDYTGRISLRISHPIFRAEKITALLRAPAKTAHSLGDERRDPGGERLTGTYASTFWVRARVADIDSVRVTLEDAVKQEVRWLEGRRRAMSTLVRTGGRCELFIGLFLDANTGFSLANETMARCAKLGLQLSFNLYPPEKERIR